MTRHQKKHGEESRLRLKQHQCKYNIHEKHFQRLNTKTLEKNIPKQIQTKHYPINKKNLKRPKPTICTNHIFKRLEPTKAFNKRNKQVEPTKDYHRKTEKAIALPHPKKIKVRVYKGLSPKRP